MKNLIPHQLHLTEKQIKTLSSGGAVNVPHSHFGADAGEAVVLLHPQNARKILNSYKKGKGIRLQLNPEELKGSMIQGRGFSLKNLGRTIKKGFNKNVLHPTERMAKDVSRGFKKEIVDSGVGKKIAKQLIDIGTDVVLPGSLGALSMLAGDPTGMSGQMVGQVAGQQLGRLAEKHGYGIHEKMAKLRAMRGKKDYEGEGLFRSLHKIGIKGVKKPLMRIAKETGKATAKVASLAVGDAISAYTGNPMAGEAFSRIADATAERAIDKGLKAGVSHGVKLSGREAKRMAVEAVDDYVDKHLTGTEREIAQSALAGKYKGAEDLIYDYADKKKSKYGGLELGSGVKRRGRPRKDMMGTGANMSKPYKRALKNNYGGLELNNITSDNQPSSKFSLDKRVKPSSTEMTLSPYQSNSSPAMNPFVPKGYFQEGGQMKGYGGSGLYMPSGKGLY